MDITSVATIQFENALTELKRIKHVKKALAVCVEVFAACGGDCKGTCAVPRVILKADDGREFTCCAFWLTNDLVDQAKALERQVRKRIELAADSAVTRDAAKAHRKEATDSLKLREKHGRGHTGTAVARKKGLVKSTEDDILRRAMEALHADDE